MAGILEKLSGNAKIRNTRTDLYLEFIRFRKFLENAREVVSFIEDAREKLREEYIFDTHYVLSLVDGVLERIAMLAFNASVLTPDSGKDIYAQLDVHKAFAKEAFLKSPGFKGENFSLPSSGPNDDPEVLLLRAVLAWLQGPLPEKHPSVMDFMLNVADEVIEELLKKVPPSVEKVKVGEHNELNLINFNEDSPPKHERTVSPQDIQCRPSGLMLLGFLEGEDSGGSGPGESETNRWMIVNDDEVSLRIFGKTRNILLEATLRGDIASDYVFLYSKNPFDLSSVLPQGFWIEKTRKGSLAWNDNVPTAHLEKNLLQLGSMLLR